MDVVYLVKGNNVDATTEGDVFGMEAKDALLLQPLLGKGVVGRQGRWQNGWNHKRQNVQTVEQDLLQCSLQDKLATLSTLMCQNVDDKKA